MTRISYATLFLSYLLLLLTHSNNCSWYDTSWLSTSISDTSSRDLQLLANVLYISWQRQQVTHDAQEAALTMLNQTWKTTE